MKTYDVLIVGGGAAGFFTAINTAQRNPKLRIGILERSKEFLAKVRVSGGGRCNVTHHQFDADLLSKNYPRGAKELRGPFTQFGPEQTIEWFKKRGVTLKTEADGRMFPVSDSSYTIIECFLTQAQKYNVDLLASHSVQSIESSEQGWYIKTNQGDFTSTDLVVATGSNPKIWELLSHLGHEIIAPVPSLFTCNVKDERIADLMGVAHSVKVRVPGTKLVNEGPLLITHWGFSGPAILRLSAWGARDLAQLNYQFPLEIAWVGHFQVEEVVETLRHYKSDWAKKQVGSQTVFGLTRRLCERIITASGIDLTTKWADLSKKQVQTWAQNLCQMRFEVNGKSTFKEEFVTAGGVHLREVHFKTMESKKIPHLYLTGEVLNIDAITGGFNFQNAWTTAHLAAQAIATSSSTKASH